METPSSGPGLPAESSASSDALSERSDPEVLAFLETALLPSLGDRAPRALRDALRRAIRERRTTPLERLNGRHRQELLIAIEQLMETRRRPAPEILVRLTTIVSATPAAPELVGVSVARPAR